MLVLEILVEVLLNERSPPGRVAIRSNDVNFRSSDLLDSLNGDEEFVTFLLERSMSLGGKRAEERDCGRG